MTKSILFFVTLLGLCYEACGAMLKGSGKVLQPSQFKAEKSFLHNNKENSLPPFAEDKNKNAFIQQDEDEQSNLQGKEEDENATRNLMILSNGKWKEDQAAERLKTLKSFVEKKIESMDYWLQAFQSWDEKRAHDIKEWTTEWSTLKVPKEGHLILLEVLKSLDEETTRRQALLELKRRTTRNLVILSHGKWTEGQAAERLKTLETLVEKKIESMDYWLKALRFWDEQGANEMKGLTKKWTKAKFPKDRHPVLSEVLKYLDEETRHREGRSG